MQKEAFKAPGGGLSEICDSDDVNAFIRQLHLHDIHQDKMTRLYFHPQLRRDSVPEELAMIKRASKSSAKPRPGSSLGVGVRRRRARPSVYDDRDEEYEAIQESLYGRPPTARQPLSLRRESDRALDGGAGRGGDGGDEGGGAPPAASSVIEELRRDLAAAHEAIQVCCPWGGTCRRPAPSTHAAPSLAAPQTLGRIVHRHCARSGFALVQVRAWEGRWHTG